MSAGTLASHKLDSMELYWYSFVSPSAKCDPKYIARTETFCDHKTGYTVTNYYYKQTCYSDNGQRHTYEWVESKRLADASTERTRAPGVVPRLFDLQIR